MKLVSNDYLNIIYSQSSYGQSYHLTLWGILQKHIQYFYGNQSLCFHKITCLKKKYIYFIIKIISKKCSYVYDAALLEYNNGIRESLLTAMHPHKWWFTLKTFLFGVNSSVLPIRTDDGSVTYDPSKKAEVFSTVFQNKESDQ